VQTPIGWLPKPQDLDTVGMPISSSTVAKLLTVDVNGWRNEIPLMREYFAKFGNRLPAGIKQQVDALEQRLKG
jgi:phosphoenolpyruvate carboxykinase (GTP)